MSWSSSPTRIAKPLAGSSRRVYGTVKSRTGMYVVIMDIVVGRNVEVPCIGEDERLTSKLRTIIQTLHDVNFVHNDLREPMAQRAVT